MMVKIKDANEFHEIVKKSEPVYYRDPEYRTNFRRVEPENGIRSMNPFTHPDETFYRMVSETDAQEILFSEHKDKIYMESPMPPPPDGYNRDFFLSGWEGAKTYFKFMGEQQ